MDNLRAGNTKQIGEWDLSGWKISSINKNKKASKECWKSTCQQQKNPS